MYNRLNRGCVKFATELDHMNQLVKILKGKCPNCGKGDIFSSPGNIFLLKMPKMNARCKRCQYKFERETGFFFGAMFVSYALAAAEMIVMMGLGWYLLGLSPLTVFLGIAVLVIVTSTLNFRLSRTIWIYIFFRK